MKRILTLTIALFALTTTFGFAKEPTNIALVKQNLVHYHNSGRYNTDIKNAINEAMRYLKIYQSRHLHTNKKPAIVLDIDETALSNYHHMAKRDFGGTMKQIHNDELLADDPAITPTLRLYRYAKANSIAVFFITGRAEYERKATERNLKKAGYTHWDGLILRNSKYKSTSAKTYKTAMRKKLTRQGYDIILNIGDQKSDLTGGYADKNIKLPNPYYLVP